MRLCGVPSRQTTLTECPKHMDAGTAQKCKSMKSLHIGSKTGSTTWQNLPIHGCGLVSVLGSETVICSSTWSPCNRMVPWRCKSGKGALTLSSTSTCPKRAHPHSHSQSWSFTALSHAAQLEYFTLANFRVRTGALKEVVAAGMGHVCSRQTQWTIDVAMRGQHPFCKTTCIMTSCMRWRLIYADS